MIRALLEMEPMRRRLAFELRHRHYPELNIAVPIGSGLKCPILNQDYWWSFEEVFFSDEYLPVFEQVAAPERWLDIGCHAGFFSLFTILQRRKARLKGDGAALLIDGDSRVGSSVEAIQSQNQFAPGTMQFLHGAIASKPGTVEFEESDVMSSSLSKTKSPRTRSVPVATAEQIVKQLTPPYDLVKVDIEGAEHDFLTSYGPVISAARNLLLEWHSWHFAGGGLAQIRSTAEAAGFREVSEIVPSRPVEAASDRKTGVILFEAKR